MFRGQTLTTLNSGHKNKCWELFANINWPRFVCFPPCVFSGEALSPHLGLLHSVSPRLFLLQHLCPGLGWTHISNSCELNSRCLSSLYPYCSLLHRPGRVRTRRQSSGSVGGASTSVVDSRGRSRAKVVSQSQRMYIHPTHALTRWTEIRPSSVTCYTFSIIQLLSVHTAYQSVHHISVWSFCLHWLWDHTRCFAVSRMCATFLMRYSAKLKPENLQSLTNPVYLCLHACTVCVLVF